MKTEEKIKALAKIRAFGVKKLVRLGDSYALVLPKSWVELNGIEIDGNFFVSLNVEGIKLVFSLIDLEGLEEVKVKEK